MIEDAELLRRYAHERTENALAVLVQRHIDFVYQVALPLVGRDAHHAADVTQYVFTEVARQAATLARHRVLKGWLYVTARNAAANVVRAERRRRNREMEALAMHEITTPSVESATWEQLRPEIDRALAALSDRDREAVFLRYFEGCEYPEIGARFSLSADAARLRIERALEKMRAVLARNGLASTTAALTSALTAQASLSAPTGLAATVTASALTGTTASVGIAGMFALMTTTKIQSAVFLALMLTGVLGVLLQQQARATLKQELAEISGRRTASARVASIAPADESAAIELGQLQGRVEELTRLLAETHAPPPLAPGFVATSAWRNRGRGTIGDTLETILWAKENADIAVLVGLIDLASIPRAKLAEADAAFAELPGEARQRLGIRTSAEMIALAWALDKKTSMLGAQFLRSAQTGTDSVILRINQQRIDGTIREVAMRFRRAADGWKWVFSSTEFGDANRSWVAQAAGWSSAKP